MQNENPDLQPNRSAQSDTHALPMQLVKRLTQATWAECACQTVQIDMAINPDFHSAWYRDHLVQYIAKLAGV